MILVDNNILSTFARVGELKLVFGLFLRSKLGVTPAVLAEMDQALAQSCHWLEEVKRLLGSGLLELAAPRAEEILVADSLPVSLGPGERESIAICQIRLWTFLTNDRRARNYCRQAGVRVYNLADLLAAIWRGGLRSHQFVQELCGRMEAAEGMTIPNKDSIFRK